MKGLLILGVSLDWSNFRDTKNTTPIDFVCKSLET